MTKEACAIILICNHLNLIQESKVITNKFFKIKREFFLFLGGALVIFMFVLNVEDNSSVFFQSFQTSKLTFLPAVHYTNKQAAWLLII